MANDGKTSLAWMGLSHFAVLFVFIGPPGAQRLRAWRDCLTMYRKKKTERESLSIKSRIANLFLGLLGPA